MKRLASLVGLLVLPSAAIAAPAVRIGISSSICFIQTCPGVQHPVPTTVSSETPFGVYVAALDGSGLRDASYTGTVSFPAPTHFSDPSATLPANYSFVAGDGGVKALSAVLRTLGEQTITVSDPGNNLIPGTLVMTVTGAQPSEDIPVLSPEALLLLTVLLAATATLVLRLRG
jgi:hypothetical protein